MHKGESISKIIFSVIATLFFIYPTSIQARDTSKITDWYIKDFKSKIIVNRDSSLDITEEITADCGNLPDKHGIFRSLPAYYQRTMNEEVKTPIKLLGITGSEGQSIEYSTIKNNNSITWKIGDTNKTVTGENTYIIRYKVKNTIRFADSGDFDELYWNLNGNFWQIETDKFIGTIKFPQEITKDNTTISSYSGKTGINSNNLASYSWIDKNTLQVTSKTILKAGEGITASITFPKNIISPYTPPFMEKYGFFIFLLFPLLVFVFAFRYWSKYGKDPRLDNPEMAQYDPPEKMTPLEIGMIISNGRFDAKFVSACIVDLAVRKFIVIEEVTKKGMFGKKDFLLRRLNDQETNLTEAEKELMTDLFVGEKAVRISDLQNKFYLSLPKISKKVMDKFYSEAIFDQKAQSKMTTLLVIGFILLAIGGYIASFNLILGINIMLGAIITIIFGILMPRRTEKGADLLWKAQGFRLFIKMTEKYRQEFNEKENIFEKFLPYAMVFGLVSVWVNNMKKIYGEQYFATYHPYWYTGHTFANFDANKFNSMISDLSNNMATTMASNPSSSGSGGGGFSGGGGGGGGGGGW